MPFDKPLWEMRLLENYGENQSVVFLRSHHCLSDGMGIVSLMHVMNDPDHRLKIDKQFPHLNFLTKVFLFI